MRRRGDLLPLYRVDTLSLAISQVQLPSGYSVFGMAIAPSGNQAVIEGGVTSLTFYLFDTSTNTVTETFPLPPIPGNAIDLASNAIAFSPDGTSLWTLTGCDGGACTTMVGQSFLPGTSSPKPHFRSLHTP